MWRERLVLPTSYLRFPALMAEGVGFEPTVPEGTHALQACPIVHSGTPPRGAFRAGYAAGGGGGIRTHGTDKSVQRFSRPPP